MSHRRIIADLTSGVAALALVLGAGLARGVRSLPGGGAVASEVATVASGSTRASELPRIANAGGPDGGSQTIDAAARPDGSQALDAGAPHGGSPTLDAGARPARSPSLESGVPPGGSQTLDADARPEASPAPNAGATADPQRTRRSRRRPSRARTRPAAPRYTTPRGAPALASDIGHVLGNGTRGGRWGVLVVSLTRGDTLYAHNAGLRLMPASTMKLFTAALALERLGPDHQFTTEVLHDGQLTPDGTLHGNLYLRGGGDPAFSNRFLRGEPDAPVDLLARFVAGAGIRRVTGDLIADATAFETRNIPEGWRPRYLGFGYAAPFSALSLNENIVDVVVEPGGNGSARVSLQPPASTVPVVNAVRIVAGSGARIIVRRTSEGGVEARGWIGSRSPARHYLLVVPDPALFTVGAFHSALARSGIAVHGQPRVGETPASAERVTSLPSPPLSRLVSVMNRESINIYAELIFRNAARARFDGAVGSAELGHSELRRFLAEKAGVDTSEIHVTDGSGLSYLDEVTPRALVKLLAYAHRAPWASHFHASLPVAGESELLRNRMRLTPAEGNLHAKTGTTNEVISLAGYTTARNGEVVAFAFIYNGRDRSRARTTIDVIGATLAGFIRE